MKKLYFNALNELMREFKEMVNEIKVMESILQKIICSLYLVFWVTIICIAVLLTSIYILIVYTILGITYGILYVLFK